MLVRKFGSHWGIWQGERCIATFATFEKACTFLAPEPAKFEGRDAEGLARYSNVVLG